MKIKLKLFATLSDYLPVGSRNNEIEIDVAHEASIADILAPYNIPHRLQHLVLVNGHFVPPSARAGRRLQEGDHLGVWPPIAGG